MKITFKKGKSDKIHISADGEYRLTVDETFFSSLFIRQNQEMDEDEFCLLEEKINTRRAYNYCVSLLSRREHTEKELRDKLIQKGYSEQSFAAVEKLSQQGYVSDERFASCYAAELKNLKGYGKRRIEQELRRKGVSRDIIMSTLEEIDFDDGRILDVIRRKYRHCFDDEKSRRRAINGLMRLGYSFSEIKDALNKLGESEEFSFSEVEDE